MSNPYLSFINSIGGSTGSHSTLQKLAASSSPSTSSVTTTTTTSTVSTNSSRTHASSSRPTTAPRLQEKPTTSFSSASKDNRHGSSSYSHSHSNSYSNSHSNSHSYSRPSTSASKPRSSSSHHHSSSYSNGSQSRDYKSSSSSNGNSNNYSSNNHSSSRNHDRTDSKNYGHDQDRRHSNGSKSHVSSRDTIDHRDERDDGDGRNGSGNYHAGSRNERKRERDVDTGRSDDPRGYARTSKDKDASFSEPRAKKRHTRSRSRTPSRTRSRSTSRSRSRGPSRTGTKYRERSYSPRRRPTIKSRSKSKSRSRSRSRSRSPSPMTLVKDSKPTAPPAPIPSLVPMLPQPKSPSPPAPLPVTTPIRTITPPPPPPPPQQQQRSYLDLDDTSSFSTLSSPSSYSLSPPPISVPSSPAKDLSPIKKRRMESLLQAEASYSSPSSLSSLSPEPSDHSSSERELEEGEMSPLPAKEEGTNTTAQDRPKRATKEPPKKESPSQQALELELFGKIISKPKINSTTIATAANTTSTKKAEASSRLSSINGGKQDSNLERKPTSTSSITKVKPVEYTDEEEYGSLGSIVKDEPSLNNRSNGHLGANGKRSSLDNVRTSREILTINTQKGTVTSKTVKIPQKPPKPSNGTAIQRPSKSSSSVNTSKESSQKHSSSSAVGAASRRMSILHSDQIVAAAMGRYKNHFHMLVEDSDSTVASNPSSTGGDSMHVSLEYPGKDSREKFTLMKPFLSRSKTESDDKDEYNPIDDLVQTVRIIMEHFFTPEQYKELFGTASEGLHRSLTKYKTRKDGAQFLKAVEEFNQIMRKQKSLGAIQEYVRQYGHRLPYDLVVHILQQVYSRTVAARASKLNQYEAFSNNVYGEILPILTKEFIQRTKMDESKVFVDLGCGIGNVVLQVALQTGAESYGVEIMDTPAKFAKKQAREFEARTRAFGLNHGAVSMIHGDFLDTPGLAGILARADVVLVNNYAFNSALNQSLLQLFLDLKEGCKIISLKTFVSLDHKINVRNAGSVESILRVKKYPYYTNAVSWTHNGGEYFIATVDRSAVQAFWERAMTNGGTSLDDGGSRRSSTRRR